MSQQVIIIIIIIITSDRSLVVHVSLPGQQKGAEDLDQFPSMASLGMSLVTVLDQLRISRVVVLGEAAGANIAVRFAANHPGRVSGLGGANLKHATASFPAKLKSMKGGKFLDTDLNLQNVAKYEAAYKARDEILNLIGSSLTVDSLIICGANNSACGRELRACAINVHARDLALQGLVRGIRRRFAR